MLVHERLWVSRCEDGGCGVGVGECSAGCRGIKSGSYTAHTIRIIGLSRRVPIQEEIYIRPGRAILATVGPLPMSGVNGGSERGDNRADVLSGLDIVTVKKKN